MAWTTVYTTYLSLNGMNRTVAMELSNKERSATVATLRPRSDESLLTIFSILTTIDLSEYVHGRILNSGVKYTRSVEI